MQHIRGNYTLRGIINITDHANAAADLKHVEFVFCKQGEDFYYKLGTTATINAQGVYLYIDHKIKTILISGQKKVVYDNALKAIGDMAANMQAENYKLSSKIEGDRQTLSLINENHISCKQYSITFTRKGQEIKRLYLRLANAGAPGRTDNEKIVDVTIATWKETADMGKYLTRDEVIKNTGGGWKTVNEFKNYRLIRM